MKYYMLLVALFAGCLVSNGEFAKKELKRLGEVEISGIREDTKKNDDRKKIETLEISTFQNNEDTEGFRLNVAVEITDKQKKTYLVEYKGMQPSDFDSEFTGEGFWTLSMPHGDLERVKITAYAVQFGIMDEAANRFIICVEKYDGVKAYDELTTRTTNAFPGTVTLKYWYMFDDPTEGEIESIPSQARAVKSVEGLEVVRLENLDD